MFIYVLCIRMCLHEVTSLGLFCQFLSTQTILSRLNKNFNATETQLFESESILMWVGMTYVFTLMRVSVRVSHPPSPSVIQNILFLKEKKTFI